MQFKHYILKLEIPIIIGYDDLQPNTNKIVETLNNDNWNDGRYSFHKEMVLEGLDEIIRHGIYNGLIAHFKILTKPIDIHTEVCQVSDNADIKIHEYHVSASGDDWKATIREEI